MSDDSSPHTYHLAVTYGTSSTPRPPEAGMAAVVVMDDGAQHGRPVVREAVGWVGALAPATSNRVASGL